MHTSLTLGGGETGLYAVFSLQAADSVEKTNRIGRSMIETVIYPKEKYTVQECSGDITKKELFETAQSFFGGLYTPNVIWDFSSAQMIDITPHNINKLVSIWIKQRVRRGGGKTAIIAPAALEYSFSKMFETIPELKKASFETRVFGSLKEAKQWFFE